MNSLSQSFPYESLSLLVNNHFTQVAFDLVRALVPSHGSPNLRTSVKRIVFTSSCTAIVRATGEKQTVLEKDWNETAVAAARNRVRRSTLLRRCWLRNGMAFKHRSLRDTPKILTLCSCSCMGVLQRSIIASSMGYNCFEPAFHLWRKFIFSAVSIHHRLVTKPGLVSISTLHPLTSALSAISGTTS
jgi:hypothetical protein